LRQLEAISEDRIVNNIACVKKILADQRKQMDGKLKR
jgi:hypothetical protein